MANPSENPVDLDLDELVPSTADNGAQAGLDNVSPEPDDDVQTWTQ